MLSWSAYLWFVATVKAPTTGTGSICFTKNKLTMYSQLPFMDYAFNASDGCIIVKNGTLVADTVFGSGVGWTTTIAPGCPGNDIFVSGSAFRVSFSGYSGF